MSKLINNIIDLKTNQIYVVCREDGMPIGTTTNKNNIKRIISEEYCESIVLIDEISFEKHDYSHEIKARLFDGEEDGEEGNEYEFIVYISVNY